jgi:hypothetical protein
MADANYRRPDSQGSAANVCRQQLIISTEILLEKVL